MSQHVDAIDFEPVEALIPQAIADSFRSGNLGVMDYYRLRNIQADTSMRDSIGGGGSGGSSGGGTTGGGGATGGGPSKGGGA